MDEQEITIDLRDLWHVLQKNIRTIKKVTCGFVAAAVVYLIVVPPTYESVALLRVKQPVALFWNPCPWAMPWLLNSS